MKMRTKIVTAFGRRWQLTQFRWACWRPYARRLKNHRRCWYFDWGYWSILELKGE